jgi:uncharacterized RDD family membrane protein YckC
MENIYQTPKAVLSARQTDQYGTLATTTQRFFNMLLDTMFFIVFSGLLLILIDMIGLVSYLDDIDDNLYAAAVFVLYYLPQEAVFGRTLGKLVTKTKVVGLNGNKISFLQALARTICRFVPFDAFTFLGGKGRPHGLHDKIPKTKVITLVKRTA